MSTIAWDGKTLAADRQSTNNSMKRTTSKIVKMNTGEVMACTGSETSGLLMMEWYKAGADLLRYPAIQNDKDLSAHLIVARPDGMIAEYFEAPMPLVSRREIAAWGSGRDFAVGAMARGATAAEAIEVAMQFDIYSGYGVESFEPGVKNA